MNLKSEISFKHVQYVLMDIEGTTTSKDFVFQILFPFADKNIQLFLAKNAQRKEVSTLLEKLAVEIKSSNLDEMVSVLRQWIKQDLKHPILKAIQGMIWEEGYQNKSLKSHVYSDVLGNLKLWKSQKKQLGIYSSGSVLAQKLLFAHTEQGDFTPYFSHYFDTAVGAKREAKSYINIAKMIDVSPKNILFLSDVEAELKAAVEADFQVALINRDQSPVSGQYTEFDNFSAISL